MIRIDAASNGFLVDIYTTNDDYYEPVKYVFTDWDSVVEFVKNSQIKKEIKNV